MPGSQPHQGDAERPLWIEKPLSASSCADFPIVAVGASAGGLEACKKLLDALPAGNGMAFIIVQHLDPSHDSMMVGLLAGHSSMPVLQATDGMAIESERVYVIPPGVYLSVDKGALRLSRPQERHGARLPFDFLLHSLASEYGARAVCVILSGTGADGSLGLKAIKEKGGLVIAQEVGEADYDGMPRNAIATGAVDLVLPAAKIAKALVSREQGAALAPTPRKLRSPNSVQDALPKIIDLLRAKTVHDFTHYKHGTLERRVERRMAMAAIKTAGEYLDFLLRDAGERDQLSRDLLINVTGFFRDAPVFDFLAKNVIPGLVRDHAPDRPLRIWVAGCSSGEETYSLAMLFREQIDASKRDIKLQVFASDVDPDAVASAREGLYPESIEADVSPSRLAAFFSTEDRSYRVSPELRSSVVFTVQDVLADPPFARLDFVSCRNLLIYLRPEAQAKVASIFHFALREGGLLLLGNAEMVGAADGRFVVVSKSERLYRRVGGSRPGEFGLSPSAGDAPRMRTRPGPAPAPSRQASLAELCRSMVVETYGPAAVLINRKLECLHFQGPIDRYLKVASGRPAYDLIAMAREGVQSKLRSAVQRALRDNARVVMPGGRTNGEAGASSFRIVVEPAPGEREDLLLVCFVEEPAPEIAVGDRMTPADVPRVVELERELEATKVELQSAIRNLETSSEEQMTINEEALSVNEEYQSTNEELLASKEELQSLNEELNALNSQLQETLERQRTTADDLRNVLYSTDVATIFLDTRFNIRFFTPATKALFNVIPSDVGRPLTDLKSLAADGALLDDAQKVLKNQTPVEREIQGQSGYWFIRRILPYRASDEKIEGVVITFEDITDRRRTADALAAAKRQAELATIAKSRFLAAASHDLRQPLQTLALLQGLLAKRVVGEKKQKLVDRIDEALSAMTGMLNTLLDINQIEVGAVTAETVDFPVNDLFDRLRDELTYHAQAAGLALRVMPCALSIRSDPRLLEQMMRNLLSNALKYTQRGRVLVGCRRRRGKLRIEVWDTGVGIPTSELQAIFEEYHQLDNAARQRSHGLGLGLSIVKSLGELLGHRIRVRSLQGKGSVFSIEVPLSPSGAASAPDHRPRGADDASTQTAPRTASILIIEDDPEVREHLELFLREEGYDAATAVDGPAALELAARRTIRPDLVLADYNLPNGMNGIQVSQKLRQEFSRQIPFIILTGDISTETLRDIALHDCVQFNKPVKLRELTQAIEKLLAKPPAAPAPRPERPAEASSVSGRSKVFVVDDDDQVREALRVVLEDDGRVVESYPSCEAFLAAYRPDKSACLLIDAYLPGMSGLELLQKLHDDGHRLPSIMITGNSDVPMAVKAMKAGALDFIEKPIGREELIASIERALELSQDSSKLQEWRESAATHLAGLTPRQREVMERVLAGHASKNIAADLGISQRTVENHRASIMKRTGSKSLPALARLALVAAGGVAEPRQAP
ncbi:MAG: chemotaxis protein CheB [Roseiarcus sp.]|jgi:two-component system CheB/CheR fusion protein